ncbi:MAG: DUF523 and DUF1722 domain-containing protein, partial [candidate division Zixibacteria bacterium]|nr:DUF523 and DUF1722 domain-containing protein [candidate division Zixibacteria bacterium]
MGTHLAPTRFVKPVVILSRCLGKDVCRYDGQPLGNEFVRELKRWVKLIPVCPEMEIGLGLPRDKIILVQSSGGLTLHQPATGRKLTRAMTAFTRQFLGSVGDIDGCVLKSKSPSCGLMSTNVFADPSGEGEPVGTASGLFASGVAAQFGALPIADEQQLADLRFRERWLVRLFTLADFRALGLRPSRKRLVAFH